MVSADEFYRQTNNNFKTVFGKMDEFTKEINNLKSAYNSHIAVGKALEKSKRISTKQKNYDNVRYCSYCNSFLRTF